MEGFDEYGISSPEIYGLLTKAWITEKNCPDLLKNKSDLVDCMMDQLKQMEENLNILRHDDFIIVPHRMEIDRIRYIISSYLRTRLEKIEAYTNFFLKRDRDIPNEENRHMSEAEFKFAEQYLETQRNHLQVEAFKYMPSLLFEYGGDVDVEIKPDLETIVVLKVFKSFEGIWTENSPIDLCPDSCHLVPYKNVKSWVECGFAVCI